MSVTRICREAMEEVMRRPHGEPRWCFICRRRRPFLLVVEVPIDERSSYGPTPHVECASCGIVDGDLFPPREREWED